MTNIMWFDFFIYIIIFRLNPILGFSFLVTLCSGILTNQHNDNTYQISAMLTLACYLIFLPKNYKIIAGLFILKSIMMVIVDWHIVIDLMIIVQIIVALDTDSFGSPRGILNLIIKKAPNVNPN